MRAAGSLSKRTMGSQRIAEDRLDCAPIEGDSARDKMKR